MIGFFLSPSLGVVFCPCQTFRWAGTCICWCAVLETLTVTWCLLLSSVIFSSLRSLHYGTPTRYIPVPHFALLFVTAFEGLTRVTKPWPVNAFYQSQDTVSASWRRKSCPFHSISFSGHFAIWCIAFSPSPSTTNVGYDVNCDNPPPTTAKW